MARAPAASRTEMISSRPDLARWWGKNPRLPTITPNVILRCAAMFSAPSILAASGGFIAPAGSGTAVLLPELTRQELLFKLLLAPRRPARYFDLCAHFSMSA
jgi:hypothetical protein